MADKEKKYPLKLNENYYVVTANDLIKGRQKMSLRESQLLFIAISQVVKEDTDFKTYTTTVPELARFMGIDENSLYRDLEGICTSLMQKVVKIQVGGENARGRKKWEVFHWISSAKYDNGTLTLRLSDDIKPYLLELDSYYSQTMLGTLMTFRSYYATRLYQYLIADTGAKWDTVEEWTFTCDELRELFQVGEKQYKLNRDLIRYTIKPALAELHQSDYAYIYDYTENRSHKRGRPLESVTFKAIFFENGKNFTAKEKKEHFLQRTKEVLETELGETFQPYEQLTLIDGMPEPTEETEEPAKKKGKK